ncbi:MAG: TolC family protein, partial [Burkholderiales bacterium]
YNAMQAGIFQLLFAQQQQIAAGRQYIETLHNYWLSRTQLELILSGRLAEMGSSSNPTAIPYGISEMQTGGH